MRTHPANISQRLHKMFPCRIHWRLHILTFTQSWSQLDQGSWLTSQQCSQPDAPQLLWTLQLQDYYTTSDLPNTVYFTYINLDKYLTTSQVFTFHSHGCQWISGFQFKSITVLPIISVDFIWMITGFVLFCKVSNNIIVLQWSFDYCLMHLSNIQVWNQTSRLANT